jgi:hypothetical protein
LATLSTLPSLFCLHFPILLTPVIVSFFSVLQMERAPCLSSPAPQFAKWLANFIMGLVTQASFQL